MLSRYEWQRSIFEFNGNFSHQDLYNSDTPGGGFDPLDPGGGDPDGGAATIGQTRTSLGMRPTFEHEVSERARLGMFVGLSRGAIRRRRRPVHPDRLRLRRRRWLLVLGAQPFQRLHGGRIRVTLRGRGRDRDDRCHRRTAGLRLPLESPPTGSRPRSTTSATRRRRSCPLLFEETTSDFGGTLTAFRKLEVSEWRLSVGTDLHSDGRQRQVGDRPVSDSV